MRTEEERARIARQYAQASGRFEKLTTENRQEVNALVRALYRKQQEERRRKHDTYAILQAQYLRDTRAVLAFAVDQDVLTGKIGMCASPLCYFMAQQVDDS